MLAPIILEPKPIIQTLCRQKIDWHYDIPADLKERFVSWKERLQSWDAIQIPRWYRLRDATEVQLHIFADASIFAYGTMTYFRYFEGNNAKCSLIISKLRLALMKEKALAVPRFELQGVFVACRIKIRS